MGCGHGSRLVAAAAGGCREVVLDAEVVAVDRGNSNALKSFQDLSTRARGTAALHEARSTLECIVRAACGACRWRAAAGSTSAACR